MSNVRGAAQCSVQTIAENFEIHRSGKALQRIAEFAELLTAIGKIKKTKLPLHAYTKGSNPHDCFFIESQRQPKWEVFRGIQLIGDCSSKTPCAAGHKRNTFRHLATPETAIEHRSGPPVSARLRRRPCPIATRQQVRVCVSVP